MEELVVETDVRVPPEEAFAFLRDFPGYVRYSQYLDGIEQYGDGDPGTRYHLNLSWWRVSYTAVTEVTDIDPPERIHWRVLRAVDAHGFWDVTPIDDGDASHVQLHIRFDADSADASVLNLPRLVSLSWVIEKLRPLVREEATSTVERIVADLEGEPRPVDLTVRRSTIED